MPRRVEDGAPVDVPLPPAPPSSPVIATASTSTRKKRNVRRKKASRLQSEEHEKKRRKVFDDDDYSDDEENQNRTDVEEKSGVQARTLTMMVTTPVKKTPPSANDVAQKHGISPRKTPGRKKKKKKKNRKNGGTGGDNEMTAMVHSFKSVSLSWHDARSVDLRMWRMQR